MTGPHRLPSALQKFHSSVSVVFPCARKKSGLLVGSSSNHPPRLTPLPLKTDHLVYSPLGRLVAEALAVLTAVEVTVVLVKLETLRDV